MNATVTKGATVEATLSNQYTRDTGSLKVTKAVTVNGAATTTTLMDGTYSFTVAGTNVTPATSKTVTITFANGIATSATIDGTAATVTNGSVELSGLPTGSYTVTETLTDAQTAAGITLVGQNGISVTVTKDATTVPEASFTNNRDVGSLKVNKTVSSDPASAATKSYSFTVSTGSGDSLRYVQEDNSLGTTAYTFTGLTTTAPVTLTNLPVGTYTVTEDTSAAAITDYTLATTSTTTVTATVAKGQQPAEVTLNNQYTQDKGSLKVTKALSGAPTGSDSVVFKVTIKNSAGKYLQSDNSSFGNTATEFDVSVATALEINNLPVDTYTVEEKTGTGYTDKITNYTWTETGSTTSGSGEVKKNETATVALTNVYTQDKGALKVTKALSGAPTGSDSVVFKVTIKNSAGKYLQSDNSSFGNTATEFDVSVATALEINNLPVDTYTVEEKTGTGYTDKITNYTWTETGSTTSGSGEVKKNETATVALTNAYARQTASLIISKQIVDTASGQPMDLAESFNFTLELDEALDASYAQKNVTVTTINNHSVLKFSVSTNSAFTLYNLPVGATYTITEDPGNYTPSPNNPTGGTISNGTNTLAFTNIFTEEKSITLGGSKEITGREFATGDAWTFTVTGSQGAPMPKDDNGNTVNTVTINPTSGTTADFSFGTVTYTHADIDKPYTYTVKESIPDGAVANELNGITYDTTEKIVTVKVEYASGGLKITNSAETTPVEFTNTYKANEVEVDPTAATTRFGTKAVTATTEAQGSQEFEFTLTAGNNTAGVTTPMPDSAKATVTFEQSETTGDNNPPKAIPFGTITFEAVGTYNYKITESERAGWTTTVGGDKKTDVDITVTVTDNGKGQLEASVTDTAAFSNAYEAKEIHTDDPEDPNFPTATNVFGKKNLATKMDEDVTFTFELTGQNNAPMPGNETATATAEVEFKAGDTGEKNIPFDVVTYMAPGTYVYTVTEKAAGAGWETEYSAETVTVKVVDNGEGQLVFETVGTVTITNTFKSVIVNPDDPNDPESSGKVTGDPFIQKTVVDEKGEGFAEKSFAFSIVEVNANGSVKTDNAQELKAETGLFEKAGTQTAKVGQKFEYTETGTYTYLVAETTEAENGDGWTMDSEAKRVTVTVTEGEDGQLEANIQGAKFTNTYDSSPEFTIEKEPVGIEQQNPDRVTPGDVAEFTITVTNTGNVTITGIVVTDELEGAKLEPGNGYTVNADGTATIASLAPNTQKPVVITATYVVQQADIDRGSVTNKATAGKGKDPGDKDVPEVDSETPIPIPQVKGLSVTKQVNNAKSVQARAGQTVRYSILVTNTGNVTLKGITVEDPMLPQQIAPFDLAPNASMLVPSPPGYYTYTVTEEDVARGTAIYNTAVARANDGTTGTDTVTVTPVRPGGGGTTPVYPVYPVTPGAPAGGGAPAAGDGLVEIDDFETPLGLGGVYLNLGECYE